MGMWPWAAPVQLLAKGGFVCPMPLPAHLEGNLAHLGGLCRPRRKPSCFGRGQPDPGDRAEPEGRAYLDPVLGPLLQVGDDGVVPQVYEPGPEVLNADGAGQKEARACGEA